MINLDGILIPLFTCRSWPFTCGRVATTRSTARAPSARGSSWCSSSKRRRVSIAEQSRGDFFPKLSIPQPWERRWPEFGRGTCEWNQSGEKEREKEREWITRGKCGKILLVKRRHVTSPAPSRATEPVRSSPEALHKVSPGLFQVFSFLPSLELTELTTRGRFR